MSPEASDFRECLQQYDFRRLFVEVMGWDHPQPPLERILELDGCSYTLTKVAHKRGVHVYLCSPCPNGEVPDLAVRRKLNRMLARLEHEHLIVYIDGGKTVQVWQTATRRAGGPIRTPEHTYRIGQSGNSLIAKLQHISFDIEEEEGLDVFELVRRRDAAFAKESVTKKFYDRFQKEHKAFHGFIHGIPDEGLQRWYASVLLNRLMFLYFIQSKGYLDGRVDYLRGHLSASRDLGQDRYYRGFLKLLFFEGLAKPEAERSPEARRTLGRIPYLNGGIFALHQIEQLHGRDIRIPDSAFEQLFDFFDSYHWLLDERPLKKDNEINPDVLGYIFEKYINQKQMGAYYTKEDITEYIGKNTIIPFLFDAARKQCAIAFRPEGAVWRLLRDEPDRYIHPAVRHGTDRELPADIAAGEDDVTCRDGWNRPAPEEYALPTEIWREVVARRARYAEVKARLEAGAVTCINDLITYNLDIRQFAQDVIETCEGPELLRAFYKAITRITVLDPTCGSGAFLFAALNILEPLYEACLERMVGFVGELEAQGPRRPGQFSDFRETLAQVDQHPNQRYFVLKSIILNNLYGVDIMEEAVEICKLRLFLKLAAQVDCDPGRPNLGIEPLPDIDFNVLAGNTLVGFATLDEAKRAVTSKLDFDNTWERITEKAEDLDRLFVRFREQQTQHGGAIAYDDKHDLAERSRELTNELDTYLAKEYGVEPSNPEVFGKWRSAHQPFHWFAEFYGIIKGGGFDVVVGNPPYLELSEVDYAPRGFASLDSRAIHAMCLERSTRLLGKRGCMSMIVPLALVSTQRMRPVQGLLEHGRQVWYSNYSWRPAKLFDTVNRALTIVTAVPSALETVQSTSYQKWTAETRNLLMSCLNYQSAPSFRERPAFWVPKLGDAIESTLLQKLLSVSTTLSHYMSKTPHRIYYRVSGGLYWKVFTDFPPRFSVNGKPGHSTRETSFSVQEKALVLPTIALLSSDLFWWWYTITSNCRDLNPIDLRDFPVPAAALADRLLSEHGRKYIDDLVANSAMKVRVQVQTGRTETQTFRIQQSKDIIEKIDDILAQHYTLSPEETDFIKNYDIKYRMGVNAGERKRRG